jgi:hypothetical protein
MKGDLSSGFPEVSKRPFRQKDSSFCVDMVLGSGLGRGVIQKVAEWLKSSESVGSKTIGTPVPDSPNE